MLLLHGSDRSKDLSPSKRLTTFQFPQGGEVSPIQISQRRGISKAQAMHRRGKRKPDLNKEVNERSVCFRVAFYSSVMALLSSSMSQEMAQQMAMSGSVVRNDPALDMALQGAKVLAFEVQKQIFDIRSGMPLINWRNSMNQRVSRLIRCPPPGALAWIPRWATCLR